MEISPVKKVLPAPAVGAAAMAVADHDGDAVVGAASSSSSLSTRAPGAPAVLGASAGDDDQDSSDDDDFFDQMVAATATAHEEREGPQQAGPINTAATQQQRRAAGVDTAEERWIESVLDHATATSVIREEGDAVWWDGVLSMVALGPASDTFGRADGAYPIDCETRGLLLRKFLAETRGLPRAAPLVRGRPLAVVSVAQGSEDCWQWWVDNLAAPKAAVAVRSLGRQTELFLHALETNAATSLLSCVLSTIAISADCRWALFFLDPLHESAATSLLSCKGLAPTHRANQRLYAVPASETPAHVPSPLEADGRNDENNLSSPPKPPLKMPRDRREESVVLRPFTAAETAQTVAEAASTTHQDLLPLLALGAPGVEAYGLWYMDELACAVAGEPAAAWVRSVWTHPSYRGRGFEHRTLHHLLRQWRAAKAGQPQPSSSGGGRSYLPLIWVDEAEGANARTQQRVQQLHEALTSLGFAPIDGMDGAGVTLEGRGGGLRDDAMV